MEILKRAAAYCFDFVKRSKYEPKCTGNLYLEALKLVFERLMLADLRSCSLVRREWRNIAEPIWKNCIYREMAFGKQKWQEHFQAYVGTEPPFPEWVHPYLKTVGKIRMLVLLIPSSVNGEPFDLRKLGQLAKKVFPNSTMDSAHFVNHLGNSKNEKAHWAVMQFSNDTIFMYKRSDEIPVLCRTYGNPLEALPAATALLVHSVSNVSNGCFNYYSIMEETVVNNRSHFIRFYLQKTGEPIYKFQVTADLYRQGNDSFYQSYSYFLTL